MGTMIYQKCGFLRLDAHNSHMLTEAVNNAVRDGWRPTGGVFKERLYSDAPDHYCQMLWKPPSFREKLVIMYRKWRSK